MEKSSYSSYIRMRDKLGQVWFCLLKKGEKSLKKRFERTTTPTSGDNISKTQASKKNFIETDHELIEQNRIVRVRIYEQYL